MGSYRKKPVVIEAVQWDGRDSTAVDFLPKGGWGWGFADHEPGSAGALVIDTLEGDMRCNVGDWIIKGVQGEFYPCKPDIFDATYETV